MVQRHGTAQIHTHTHASIHANKSISTNSTAFEGPTQIHKDFVVQCDTCGDSRKSGLLLQRRLMLAFAHVGAVRGPKVRQSHLFRYLWPSTHACAKAGEEGTHGPIHQPINIFCNVLIQTLERPPSRHHD